MKNLPDPSLSLAAGIAGAIKNTSTQTGVTSSQTGGANRLAGVPNRPSEGTAPMGNKLAPLPLPPS